MDLGSGFSYEFFSWAPDHELNPQYEGVADVEKAGIILSFNGTPCGSSWFDTPEVQAIPGRTGPVWQVVSLDPLHLEPSIQTYDHKMQPEHHGWIRGGVWVGA